MVVKHVLYAGGIEDAALARAAIEQDVARHGVPRAARPCGKRYRKAHLRPVEDRCRQYIGHCFAENALGRPARQLPVVRQAGAELHELVIEERHAAFDRRSHAHLVLLHQQLDEVRLDVGVQQAIEQGAAAVGPIEVRDRRPVRPAGGGHETQRGREQPALIRQPDRSEVVEAHRCRRAIHPQKRSRRIPRHPRRQ